tara:strand:- start:528 stop:1127 length:600 start_codon:yes stop_codon:yes gene_type:complete
MAKKITETFEDLFATKLDNVLVDIQKFENNRTRVGDDKIDVCEDLFGIVYDIKSNYDSSYFEAYEMANNHFDFVQKIIARDQNGNPILFKGKQQETQSGSNEKPTTWKTIESTIKTVEASVGTENMPYDFKDTRKKYNEIREQKLQNDLPKLFKQALKRLTKLLSFEKLEAFYQYLGEYIKDTKLEMEQQKQLKETKAS